MGKTTISWTEETWNPIKGCSRISPGCEHCYAETIAKRFSGKGLAFDGYATKRGWTRKVSLLPHVLAKPLGWRDPKLVFVSMSDPFHEKLTNDEIAAMFGVMTAARKHTFQILTKRAKRMAEWFAWVAKRELPLQTIQWSPRLYCRARAIELFEDHEINERYVNRGLGTEPVPLSWPLDNVWLGVSAESQEYADERIPHLLDCPAIVRFVSCEPLLGHINLQRIRHPRLSSGYIDALMGCSSSARGRNVRFREPRLHWVIAGAESGADARACEVDWLRSLRNQCWPSTKFWLKQAESVRDPNARKGCSIAELYPISIGKESRKKKGALVELPYLDGEQHTGRPEWAIDLVAKRLEIAGAA